MSGVGTLTAAGLRRRHRGSAVVFVALCAAAATAVVGGLGVLGLGPRAVDRAAAAAHVSHVTVSAEPSAVAAIRADARLVEVAGPFPVVAAEIDRPDGPISVRVVALDRDAAVSRPLLRTGRWLAATDEVVLEAGLGVRLGGGTLRLRAGDRSLPVRVVGSAVDLTDCAYPQCSARLFASPAAVAALGGTRVELRTRVASADQSDQVAAELLGLPGVLSTETWPDTRRDYLAIDSIFGSFLVALGVFLMVLVAVVLTASAAAVVISRRRELALLKAAGSTPGEVTLAVLAEHLVLGAGGVVVGWVAGTLLSTRLTVGVGRVLAPGTPDWSLGRLGLSATIVGGALVIAGWLPAWRAGRTATAAVLSDVPSGRGVTIADRIGRRLNLGPGASYAVHDASARPSQSVLAAATLLVALVGAITATGVISSLRSAASDPHRTGDPWDVVVTRGSASPRAVESAISATPGIAAWYTLTDDRATLRSMTFRARAVGGDPRAARYRIGGGRAATAVGEATVGWGFMQRFGVHVGDRLAFDVSGGRAQVTVVGWHRDVTDSGETLLWRDEQRRQLQPGVDAATWRIVVTAGASDQDVRRSLADRLGESARVQTYRNTVDLGPFIAAMVVLVLVGAGVSGLYLAVATIGRCREAARSIGVQRTLGSTTADLVGQHALSGALVAVPAALLGVPLGLLVMGAVSDAITEDAGAGPGLIAAPSLVTTVTIGVLGVVLAAVAGGVGVLGIARRTTAELVRGE